MAATPMLLPILVSKLFFSLDAVVGFEDGNTLSESFDTVDFFVPPTNRTSNQKQSKPATESENTSQDKVDQLGADSELSQNVDVRHSIISSDLDSLPLHLELLSLAVHTALGTISMVYCF